uniref:Uncharacterized protein n=1 Tax=Rhizophora mucronata TaxID=61149 RepID=A0A2P2NHD5_RHIMU
MALIYKLKLNSTEAELLILHLDTLSHVIDTPLIISLAFQILAHFHNKL